MLNRQLAFNDAVAGLWAQQAICRPADTSNTGCAYRNRRGQKCAVGMLIPDEKYDVHIEGKYAIHRMVLEAIDPKYGIIDRAEDHQFLGEMQQQLHDDIDTWNPEGFIARVKLFAHDYKLNIETELKLP